MTSTSPSPLGNFGPQRPDFDAFLSGVTGSSGPIDRDWRRQTATRQLMADGERLGELRERAIEAARAAGRDDFNPGTWAGDAASTAAGGMSGTEREAFVNAIVDAAWAVVVEDLLPAEAAELYAAVEPSLPQDGFRPVAPPAQGQG